MSRANPLVPVKNRSSERRHDLEAEPPSPVNIASILAARVDLHHWFGDVLQPTRIHTHAGRREPQARPSRDGELCRAGAPVAFLAPLRGKSTTSSLFPTELGGGGSSLGLGV
jgi:hypothetical protein